MAAVVVHKSLKTKMDHGHDAGEELISFLLALIVIMVVGRVPIDTSLMYISFMASMEVVIVWVCLMAITR